jgi:hypothetical protein
MLGTGARYAEYGITGGFFLFTTALILGLVFPATLIYGADSLGGLLSVTVGKFPPIVQPAVQSLLVALGLLSVFIIGLVLEIFGSLWVPEAFIFREHLVGNKWIANFVQAEMPDYEHDYILILNLTDKETRISDLEREQGMRFNLWSRKYWVWWWETVKDSSQKNKLVQHAFRRLEFAFVANVLTSGAKTEILTEQISICRMSRSIATALAIGACEMLLGIYGVIYLDLSSQFSRALYHFLPIVFIILLIAGATLLFKCALAITRGAYSRFAYILVSLVYAGWKRTPQSDPMK